MTVTNEFPPRVSSYGAMSTCLEDKFEVVKDIGDGSFGSVVLARVRTAGSHIARRGSVVSHIQVPSAYMGSQFNRSRSKP